MCAAPFFKGCLYGREERDKAFFAAFASDHNSIRPGTTNIIYIERESFTDPQSSTVEEGKERLISQSGLMGWCVIRNGSSGGKCLFLPKRTWETFFTARCGEEAGVWVGNAMPQAQIFEKRP
ncbi:hypothetical protein AA106555_1937 [Neokomagataea thailandica NBRC 106555]|uniref:Uncharacterized protein n=1 Tax=Neokomagataea thailandica NBRC 106555 TaxID=1223520 RepID=A0ABQ0QSF8_9PROT|nr:hypothetical protein AA106555_1937 [Neokomagataea thailandica NBRC 106555]